MRSNDSKIKKRQFNKELKRTLVSTLLAFLLSVTVMSIEYFKAELKDGKQMNIEASAKQNIGKVLLP